MASKILFVENDAAQLTLISIDLKKRGFEVAMAKSAAEGKAKIAQDAYDVVLTDLKLGDGNGLEVLQAAKRLGIGRNTLWRKLKSYGIS